MNCLKNEVETYLTIHLILEYCITIVCIFQETLYIYIQNVLCQMFIIFACIVDDIRTNSL